MTRVQEQKKACLCCHTQRADVPKAHQNYLDFVATNVAGKCSDVASKTTTFVITDTAGKYPDILSLKSPKHTARILQRSPRQW